MHFIIYVYRGFPPVQIDCKMDLRCWMQGLTATVGAVSPWIQGLMKPLDSATNLHTGQPMNMKLLIRGSQLAAAILAGRKVVEVCDADMPPKKTFFWQFFCMYFIIFNWNKFDFLSLFFHRLVVDRWSLYASSLFSLIRCYEQVFRRFIGIQDRNLYYLVNLGD